ncbi:transposase [Elizabethkingia sp. JS20170427COW]|uniref:transposase n=1 Tax=Elizabethkingia sp. JS20170427COW TaxID=2583851 RepID=UPI0011108199|nr:transposase [Elizabethkingia sp. JS20170427COW]QCX54103.1 hypothetical protein FGE20_10315 [Elizabethkingia sp. JS20170427COW]
MRFNPNIHHRHSIRLKGYDYSQEGLYFITICVQDREFIFGDIKNGILELNPFGKIASQEWENSEKIRDNIKIHEYIIMPNHIHGIIEILFKKDESKEEKDRENKKGGEDKGKGEDKGESKGESKDESKGELRFAPTVPTAPTAPTAPTNFKSPSQTIGSIIRGFKIATIKKIKDYIQEIEKKEEIKGKGEKGNKEIKRISWGELQFAPTIAPTEESEFAPTPIALTAPIIEKIKSLNFKIWQRNYYEIIIRDEKAYQRISEYIINNPQKWEEDKFHKKIKK